MKNYKLHLSDGFRDIYGYEMLVRREIENKALDLFSSYGYEQVKTPGVEYLDVYTLGESWKTNMYNLINRQGEVLALRTDMTASVARFVCTNNSLTEGVHKYCYSADMYRYPNEYQGKMHQFLQAGVEIIGDDSIEAEVSAIYLASKVLEIANCKSYTINIGSSAFLKALFDDFKLSDELKDAIYASIHNKDYVTLREILNSSIDKDKADFILDLMMRGGRLKYIESLMSKLDGLSSCEVLKHLKQVYLMLNELNVENIIVDFSIYSGAEYYTGIIFNIYADNITRVVVSGGRCDNLFKEYGKDYPNVGFGVDLDSLADYCVNNNLVEIKNEKCLSYAPKELYIKAMKGNEELRAQGMIVSHINFSSLDEAIDYAKRHCFTKVIEYTNNGMDIKEVK